MREAVMRVQQKGLPASVLLIGVTLSSIAMGQGTSPAAPPSPVASPQNLTGKERLG